MISLLSGKYLFIVIDFIKQMFAQKVVMLWEIQLEMQKQKCQKCLSVENAYELMFRNCLHNVWFLSSLHDFPVICVRFTSVNIFNKKRRSFFNSFTYKFSKFLRVAICKEFYSYHMVSVDFIIVI